MTSQEVLVVPEVAVRDLYRNDGFYDDNRTVRDVFQRIRESGVLRDRESAEGDDTVKQVVACAVVLSADRLLCLRRSKRSNRESLRLRYSLMIGGHVEGQDLNDCVPLEHCVRRELREEIGLEDPIGLEFVGFAVDPFTRAGSLHLGAVFRTAIPALSIVLTSEQDSEEFVHHGRKRTVKLRPHQEVRRLGKNLDPWSRLFVASHRFQEIFGLAPAPEVHQLRLTFSEPSNH